MKSNILGRTLLIVLTSVLTASAWLAAAESKPPPSGEVRISIEHPKLNTPSQPARVPASPETGEQLKWWVVGGGGGKSTSTNYILCGTAGQTAAGLVTSTNYKLNQGFWQSFGGCCVGTRGNVNCAGIIDLSDLSVLICYLTCSSKPTLCCPDAANVNGVGIVDLSDLSMLIAYLTATPRPTLPNCP